MAAHQVDSSPAHGAVYALVPDRVLINFDASLGAASSISVAKNGAAIQAGTTTVGGLHNLSMASSLPPSSGDGVYLVTYAGCRQDGSCEQGQLAFTVDGSTRSSFVDVAGKGNVAVDMRNVKFEPARIVVSAGTAVVWTNRDTVAHFVNTDPHPSHNNLLDMNSLELKQGDSYAYTFRERGEWRYHCSAHTSMTGSVIVR